MNRELITTGVMPHPMRWHWLGYANAMAPCFVLRVETFPIGHHWLVKTIHPGVNGEVTWDREVWVKHWLGEIEGMQ